MKAYKVVDAKTDAILYIGSKKECEDYIKRFEWIWHDLKVIEVEL